MHSFKTRTILVTGSDTGVGKTHVVAALARLLGADGARVQIVKVLETGVAPGVDGDAQRAARTAGGEVEAFTLATFAAALAPAAAAHREGKTISLANLLERMRALPACDWRILEGAGGIATPVDTEGHDWADFAIAAGVEATVVVVPDRLGAINQARLAHGGAAQCELRAGVWLNALGPVDAAVAASTREALGVAGVPVWAELAHGALVPAAPDKARAYFTTDNPVALDETTVVGAARVSGRCRQALEAREAKGLRRVLKCAELPPGALNLADNDYLALARDPGVAAAVGAAARTEGTSASASPLITGWRAPHARLVDELCEWHGFPCGLLWSSGYAANSAVLGLLPQRGDLVLADRLIHHSMIAGLLRSGARLQRYEHLQLAQLEEMLQRAAAAGRPVFVVTESVFSMDGDFPDFARLAELKRRFGFCLVVDEAHALGWYGPEGAGLLRAAGVEAAADVLVGTLGKTLASGGAYALFRDEAVRDFLANEAGEFVYSTALSPLNAVAASAALVRVRELAPGQRTWQEGSRDFRARLRAAGWAAPAGDSPIVPVGLNSPEAAVAAAEHLRGRGIFTAAVRPPTVPKGTSRLRFSLKRTFDATAATRVIDALVEWRSGR